MHQPLTILVCGVSSHYFRVESFDDIENAVLHFIPEEYLSPFARAGSMSMLKDLFRRCGLSMKAPDYERVAEACGDFPYWMRMASSFIHRSTDPNGRPRELESELVTSLLEQFIEAEGVDIARVALEDLRRKTAEPLNVLESALASDQISLASGKILTKYGLASQAGNYVRVTSAMVRHGARALTPPNMIKPSVTANPSSQPMLTLGNEEWTEELAIINRRRNILERKLRQFIQVALKLSTPKGSSWTEKVLSSLPEGQRSLLGPLSGDQMMEKLFWKDISQILKNNWPVFESTLGDKAKLESAIILLNDRPDTHAKPIDAADVALYRRELSWLEDRLA